jgi:hypothetical protein
VNQKQSAAMRVLRAVGKQGGSSSHVAELTKLLLSDVRKLFVILARRNFLLVENDTAKLSPKFLKDVPLWKEMHNAVMTVPEFEK